MRAQPIAASQNRRIVAGLPFVESLARRMAASMPNSSNPRRLTTPTGPARPRWCRAPWRRWGPPKKYVAHHQVLSSPIKTQKL